MKVKASGKSNIGRKRKLNEDSILLSPEMGLYVIADGMGGHKAGEVASRLAVDTMDDYWLKVKNNKPPHYLYAIDQDIPDVAKHLVNAISFANIVVHEAQKKPQYLRMGSTVSALLVERTCIWVANVGDSPVYLFEDGRLTMISEEHSLEAEQKNLGLLDPLATANPLTKNLLTRALGLKEKVEVYITSIKPKIGDLVIACSDGLTNYMTEKSIKTVLGDFSMPLERKVDVLINEANQAGGGDNISVILLEVVEEGKWKKFKSRFTHR